MGTSNYALLNARVKQLTAERDQLRAEVERLRAKIEAGCVERGVQYQRAGEITIERDNLRTLVGELVEALEAEMPGGRGWRDAELLPLIARAKAAIGEGER